MDDLKQDTLDTKPVPSEALRAAGLDEAAGYPRGLTRLYSLAERADWYNWPPRFMWRRILQWFDSRNPCIRPRISASLTVQADNTQATDHDEN